MRCYDGTLLDLGSWNTLRSKILRNTGRRISIDVVLWHVDRTKRRIKSCGGVIVHWWSPCLRIARIEWSLLRDAVGDVC